MRLVLWAALIAVVPVGCSKCSRGPPPSMTSTPDQDVGTLERSARESADAGPAAVMLPKALSLERLDAFIAYQAVLLEVDRGLGAEPGDGGSGAGESTERRRLEQLAAVEDDARRRSRLSDADIDAWEGLISEVLAARTGSNPVLDKQLSEKLDRLAQKAPGLDLRQSERRELDAVRARYGDEAVDLVLAREEVLRRQLEAAPEG